MKALHLHICGGRANRNKLRKASSLLGGGRVAVLPTDTNYALACALGDTKAINRIRMIRQVGKGHLFTLLCGGFEELGKYAAMDKQQFRLVKSLVPGAFSFVMRATREIPPAFAHPKRRTVGFRVPDCDVLAVLIAEHGRPLLSCTLHWQNCGENLADLSGREQWLGRLADLVVDTGPLPGGNTTVVDLSADEPAILREGSGRSDLLNVTDG